MSDVYLTNDELKERAESIRDLIVMQEEKNGSEAISNFHIQECGNGIMFSHNNTGHVLNMHSKAANFFLEVVTHKDDISKALLLENGVEKKSFRQLI